MITDLFRVNMKGWAEQVGLQMDALARVACQDLAEQVTDNTPVDTGFLVGNWQPSLNSPVLDVDEQGFGNGYAQSRAGLIIAQMQEGDVFYYTNNAAYARRIEYGFVGADSLGRMYNQRGRHMVTQAIGAWEIIVQRAALKLGYQG